MKRGHVHGGMRATAALQHSGEPVDNIGHPSTLEASPTLGDALAPKSKGGRRQGEHGHGSTHGGDTVGSWWWMRVLPLARPTLTKGQWLQHLLDLVTMG